MREKVGESGRLKGGKQAGKRSEQGEMDGGREWGRERTDTVSSELEIKDGPCGRLLPPSACSHPTHSKLFFFLFFNGCKRIRGNTRLPVLFLGTICAFTWNRRVCTCVCIHSCSICRCICVCVFTKVCVCKPSGGWKWQRSPESCDGLAGRLGFCLAHYMKRNSFSRMGEGQCQPMPSLWQPVLAWAAGCHRRMWGQTLWIFKPNSSKAWRTYWGNGAPFHLIYL